MSDVNVTGSFFPERTTGPTVAGIAALKGKTTKTP